MEVAVIFPRPPESVSSTVSVHHSRLSFSSTTPPPSNLVQNIPRPSNTFNGESNVLDQQQACARKQRVPSVVSLPSYLSSTAFRHLSLSLSLLYYQHTS